MTNLAKRSELVTNIKSHFQNVMRKAKIEQQRGRPLGQLLMKVEREFLGSLDNTIAKLEEAERLIDLEQKRARATDVVPDINRDRE